ncbi:MAG: hypothetical protein NTY31_01610 [Candidatus Falkowbacteria bacterium]|nr:hypothetical protein [Candidatus Falkowbacteria bacterium]
MKTLNLPSLNEIVLAALDFFTKNKPPRLDLRRFNFPIVVGSGNAYNAGLAIFGSRPAIVASESNFKQTLKNYQGLIKSKQIAQALIISASGEKDSVWETKLAKKYGLKMILLTCNGDSSAAKIAAETIVFRKLPEPYTYNTSTYLGMFLAVSGEKAADIKKFISGLKLVKNLRDYQAYAFILPDEFAALTPMLEIKKHELFGPHLSLRAFTYGEARHAKFVHPWNKELVISLGANKYFGAKNHRLEIKLPSGANIGLVMALSYYLIGLIQEIKPPYFTRDISRFCQIGSRAYGQKKPFPIIVR